MAGFLVMYYLGYSRGRAFFAGRRGAAKLARAERWLSRYGVALILGNRFLSGIRSVIAIGAGLGRMPWANRRAMRRDRHGGLERIAALRRGFGRRELGAGHD